MKLSQLVLLLQILFIGSVKATQSNYRCPEKCGNVTIHYPFGTIPGCYKDESYYIECNSTKQVPRLNNSLVMLSERLTRSLEVLEVNVDNGSLIVNLPIVHACFDMSEKLLSSSPKSYNTYRFPFSNTLNRFVGVGWDIDASIKVAKPNVTISCSTNIPWVPFLSMTSCVTEISQNKTYAEIVVKPSKNDREVGSDRCGYAFLVEQHKFNGDYRILTKNTFFPVVLMWSVGDTTCQEAQKDKLTYMCQDNTDCINGGDLFVGYRCQCTQGFSGNAYIKNGCQDVNECESPEQNDCLPGHCVNTNGSYNCVCPKGFQGTARRGGRCTPIKSKNRSVIIGISEGVAGTTLTLVLIYWGVNRVRKMELRKDIIKQNGGTMLYKMLFISKDIVNKAKIFTEEEMKKATNNFNNANIIGQGGYGTVYKGILTDKTIVAIKKSKVIDENQIKQFVNEVIVLSKINHPNVVKLLGLCLETHVPLLVYEYVSNNTLCHHIRMHPMLTLIKRLKICEDVAEALSYMHSTIQIIHRDVKPSNILLNDDFTAKVSDFGISTCVPPGQTHLSTFVKGTIGYVDPEYFRTSKLTEKSDVYSFGAVMVELLTGKNIHSLEISLSIYNGAAAYLASLLDRNALVQVLDDQLKRDEYSEMVTCFAKIAISCLNLDGKKRPTMEEIKQELKQLRCLMLMMEANSI